MTKEKCLIMGYGNAGKRHTLAMFKRGYEVHIMEVDNQSQEVRLDYDYWFPPSQLNQMIAENTYKFAIIATPPDTHPELLQRLILANIPALCEKPLCGFGQLEQVKRLLNYKHYGRVMMAYNYRFDGRLVGAKRTWEAWKDMPVRRWRIFSSQCRTNLPSWGLLLDHVPHSLDILRWLTEPLEVVVKNCVHLHGTAGEETKTESYIVTGFVGSVPFEIVEHVQDTPTDKTASVQGPFGTIDMSEVNMGMFDDMYKVFFKHLDTSQDFPVGLREGIKTQELVQKCKEIERAKNDRP